jgi:hypothetical protein
MASLFRSIVLVLSVLAWVGFSALVRFRSRSFSRLSCSFLLAVLLPVWFRSGSVSCSVAVHLGFLVVAVFLLWFWQFFFCWALPCGGGGVRGGVVLCSFPLFLP